MAVNFVVRKCTQCAGKLQYIKEKKIWKCLYCGAEIERQEQYDGLFTIKNVVRQSLLDLAHRRLDSALRNIIECEKIDSKYVGTLIAKISYEMIAMTTPNFCSENEAKNLLSQLKKNYEQLKEMGESITEEEEMLYECLEEDDIYATLMLVFDSLNDKKRRDFIRALLEPKEIYSKTVNNNLLSFAIKNNDYTLADSIVSNTSNLDVKLALVELLNQYPDNDNKGENCLKLLKTGILGYDDSRIIESYLTTSEDSIATKITILIGALESKMKFGFEMLIEQILKKATKEQVELVVSTLCREKLTDDNVFRLIDFAFSSNTSTIVLVVLNCLQESGQYLFVPSKYLISFLNTVGHSASEKIEVIKKCFEFKIDPKEFETVVTNYLCHNASLVQERIIVLPYLIEKSTVFPTSTIENYVLKVSIDGVEKPNIISALFEKNLNISFFHELLSNYMNTNTDQKEIKMRVIDVLCKQGIKLTPSAFIDYICNSTDEVPTKIQFIKKMIQNGSQLRGDTANLYLEKTNPNQFSSELFSMICISGSVFSEKGIEKYLLHMKDREGIRVSNLKTMIEHSNMGIVTLSCQVQHLGNEVSCNILQAYLLTTTDSEQMALEIVDFLVNRLKIKINAPITFSGTSMKLKKYVVANRDRLSDITNKICEKYKVYTMLF